MDARSHSDALLHLRCRCGQRVRVRNARPETIVNCPKCRRAIRISAAALRVAREAEATAAAAAVPPAGGAGDTAENEELERLARTLRGEPGGLEQPAPGSFVTGPLDAARRAAFLPDLLSTFILAGRPANVVHLLATAVACTLPFILMSLLPRAGWALWPILLVLNVIVVLYVAQFFWGTLSRTAAGDDDIPLLEPDWSWWDDGLLPLIYLVLVSIACFGPAVAIDVYGGESRFIAIGVIAALAAGALVWPVAILAVALGGSLLYLRPDLLVRALLGIGPVYVVPWLLVVLTAVGGYALLAGMERADTVPVVGEVLLAVATALLALYLGYVIFRILGLLYRHFRARLPFDFG